MIFDIHGNMKHLLYTLSGAESSHAYDIYGKIVHINGGETYPTFSILGDSMSTFSGYIPTGANYTWYPQEPDYNDVQNAEETWWHQFETEFGSAVDINNSYSGSPIFYDGWSDGVDSEAKSWSFIGRSDNIGTPNLILIFGGTNDASIINSHGGAVGEYKYADWTDSDLTSFRPALAYLLNKLMTEHSTAQIVFMMGSWLISSVKESVKTICAHYDVPCVELTGVSMSGGHPNKAGMMTIKNQLISFMAANGLV